MKQREFRTTTPLIGLFALLLPAVAVGDTRPEVDPQIQKAYNQMYDADFRGAAQTLAEFRKDHPADPMGPVSDAANDLFEQLHTMGVLRKDFAHGGKIFGDPPPKSASPRVSKAFRTALNDTHKLTTSALRKNSNDVQAMLANVLAATLRADYDALVKQSGGSALKEIEQATADSHKVLAVCSQCFDADLASAVENYILGQQSGVDKFFLHLTGAQANESKGLKELKDIAANGQYFRSYARVLLAIAAVRQHNNTRAHDLMVELSKEYPKNDFFRYALQSVS